MPDDTRSDDALIEDAHKKLERLLSRSSEGIDGPALDDAITALGKRLIQRSEEKQAARDAIAELQDIAHNISSDALRLIGRVDQEIGTMRRPERKPLTAHDRAELQRQLKAAGIHEVEG